LVSSQAGRSGGSSRANEGTKHRQRL